MSFHHVRSLKYQLNQQGFRLTYQRQTILYVFQALPPENWLDVRSLHAILQNSKEYISLSTIYQTLAVMTAIGILDVSQTINGHHSYRLHRKPSRHLLICRQCQYTIDFADEILTAIARDNIPLQDYQPLDFQFALYVLCPEAWQLHLTQSLTKRWTCNRRNQSSDEPEG